jgi:hypothetical protein
MKRQSTTSMIAVDEDSILDLRSALLAVSKLAAETPQFFNPLAVMEAKKIRDHVLANRTDYV